MHVDASCLNQGCYGAAAGCGAAGISATTRIDRGFRTGQNRDGGLGFEPGQDLDHLLAHGLLAHRRQDTVAALRQRQRLAGLDLDDLGHDPALGHLVRLGRETDLQVRRLDAHLLGEQPGFRERRRSFDNALVIRRQPAYRGALQDPLAERRASSFDFAFRLASFILGLDMNSERFWR
jgi:hypothetical protein